MLLYLDCGMHLVFHGNVANSVGVASQFMTDHNISSEFIRTFTPYMADILTPWLDWCHTKLFPKALWVAEDELGLVRRLSVVSGQLF